MASALSLSAATPGSQGVDLKAKFNAMGGDLEAAQILIKQLENDSQDVPSWLYKLLPTGYETMDDRAAGGPDSFGYRWADELEAGGPVFEWVDITTIGTNLAITGDDVLSAAITLPWSFPFYGNFQTTIKACTNGHIQFGTGTSTSWTNAGIPSAATPNNALYPFWDDMASGTGTGCAGAAVYYYHDTVNNRVIVEWYNMRRSGCATTSNYTLEAILYPDGNVVFQYLTLSGTINSATIGIENSTGTVALQAHLNGAGWAVAANKAIRFSYPAGDVNGPSITHTALTDTESPGPWTVNATITDPSGVASATLNYRLNAGAYTAVPMTASGSTYSASIPDLTGVIDYYITATDGNGTPNSSTSSTWTFARRPVNGGPDAFGYTWANSHDPAGPVYSWTDINLDPAAVALTPGDDTYSAVIPMGIGFPFYDGVKTSLRVSSNGFITFGASTTNGYGQALPTATEPNDVIAVFWDDMNSGSTTSPGYIKYLDDTANGRFIVQWHNVAYSGAVYFDYQVILHANGNITMNYLDVNEADVALSTTGIENATGTVGLQVRRNNAGSALTDGLSIAYTRPVGDVVGPAIVHTGLADTEFTTAYAVSATITDAESAVASADLYYRVNGGAYTLVSLTPSGSTYAGSIPGQAAGSIIDYYFVATDTAVPANSTTSTTYSFDILNYTYPPSNFSATDGQLSQVNLSWGAPMDPTAYFEGFEGSIPSNWTIYNVDGGDAWSYYSFDHYEGLGCAAVLYDLPNNDWLISPALNVTASSILSFYTKAGSSTWIPEELDVYVSTTDTQVASFTNQVIDAQVSNTTSWAQLSASLAAFAGQTIYVGFHCTSNDMLRLMIDNVSVTGMATAVLAGAPTVNSQPTVNDVPFKVGVDITEAQAQVMLQQMQATQEAQASDRAFQAFNVYRDGTRIASTTAFTYVDVPPAPNTVYSYHVTAQWDAGESNASVANTGYFVLPGPAIAHTTLTDTELPGPYTVNANVTSSGNLTGVELYYRYNGGAYSVVAMTAGAAPLWTGSIPATTAPAVIDYYLIAYDDLPSSTTSATFSFDLIDYTWAPANFMASDGNPDQINLSWSLPAAPAALSAEDFMAQGFSKSDALQMAANQASDRAFLNYNVYRDGSLIGTSTTLSYVDIPPVQLTSYTYHVTALWDGGESNASASDTGFYGRPTSGGPDAFGYSWVNSLDPSGQISFGWTDISTDSTAVAHTLTDDSSSLVVLPFQFPFYGVDQDSIYVGSNGVLGLGASITAFSNGALPTAGTPDNMICALWDDLNPSVGGTVHTLVDAIAGTFTVQYTGIFHYGTTTLPYTYQAVLSSNGEIRLNYVDMQGDLTSATVGIENLGGTDGLQVNYLNSGGSLASGVSVRIRSFTPCETATNVHVAMASGNATVNWDAVAGAASYNVFVATDGYGSYTLLGNTTGTSFVHTGAQSLGKRFYKVVTLCN